MLNICQKCNGRGLTGGRVCKDCRGYGAAAELAGTFLFWGKRIDSFQIALDRLRKIINLLTSIILSLAALVLLGYFGWFIYSGYLFGSLFAISFWTEPHLAILGFWTAILDILYISSRVIRDNEKIKYVQRRIYARVGVEPVLNQVSFADIKRFSRRNRLDVSKTFNAESEKAIGRGFKLADSYKHAEFGPLHIISSLLSNNLIVLLFARLGLHPDRVKTSLDKLLSRQSIRGEGNTALSSVFFNIVFDAYFYAHEHRRPRVSPLSLFVGAVQYSEEFREILFGLGVSEVKLKNVVAWIRVGETLRERYFKFKQASVLRPKGAMNRAMTAVATPYLDQFSQDLTYTAQIGNIPLIIDREKEVAEVFRIFEGGTKSVILVGPPGCGKESLIGGIAERMIEEEVPQILSDKRLISLSVSDLVSGVTPSEAQERLLTLLGEVARAGNTVLVVQDISGMVGVSIGEGMDLSDAFAAELDKGYFICIATATEFNFTKLIETRAIGRALERVRVDEMDENTSIQVLEAKSGFVEYTQKIFLSYDAIEKSVQLSARYIHERFLPEKAIEIMQEAATSVRNKKGERNIVTADDVAEIISEKTRVPVTEVTIEEGSKLLHLEDKLHERVIGQDEAVGAVAASLRRARAELREGKRPIANFLFLGPTGVGKTELAKTVAAVYFGDENAMIRLDMSEYQEKASINRLIGVPGETGGGILTEAVRKNPFSLLLLDELEKAHPDVLNVFLQVMDDGRLTDNMGRVIDFTNVILISTSNAGTQVIQDEVKKGTSTEEIKSKLINEFLKQYFRPEFLNRFDGIIVFKPLTQDEILQITWLMIGRIEKKLAEKGIALEIEDAAAEELALAGFDPVFGARPLRRAIQEKVENTLANFLLTQKIGRRDKVVFKSGGQIDIEKAKEI